MSKFLIYGLRDPRTNEIRYVGQSKHGLRRPKSHLLPSQLKNGRYSVFWLKKLLSLGLKPEIVVLQRFDETRVTQKYIDQAEIFWIAIGKSALGKRFTNITAGGLGKLGCRLSTEHKEKLRRACTGRKMSEETKKRLAIAISKVQKAKLQSDPNYRSRLLSCLEHSRSAECRKKRIQTLRDQALTIEGAERLRLLREKASAPEVRARMAATKRQQAATPEGRVRVLVAMKKLQTPESRAKCSRTRRKCDCVPVWLTSRVSKRCVHGYRQYRPGTGARAKHV